MAGEALSYLDWTKVDGWLSRAEGETLRMMAYGKHVLEIGSWKGRSTVCMAQVARTLVAVDHFKGDMGTGLACTFDEYTRNLERFGVADKVKTFWTSLRDFIYDKYPVMFAGTFDLAFVDCEHTEAATTEALRVAIRCVKRGGIVAWHDADFPEVRSAVHRAGLVPFAGVDTLEWALCK